MARADLQYVVSFHRIPGVGSARLGRLLDCFGTLQDAWQASERAIRETGLPGDVITAILTERQKIDPARELDRLDQHGVQALTPDDSEYPRLLRHIPHPPPVLYVRGTIIPTDELAIGVVGTRRSTSYGTDMTARLSRGLAEAGVTIVSGLALGIDTVAHRTALEYGGRTLAVFGCGLDTIYPPRNRQLAERIVENGALVSEYALGMKPDARNFPVRNRIISGLSRGVVVIEAPSRSGALITTSFAADQGRDVFAVPGSALSAASAGCHDLIRNGATLVTSADEILDHLDVARAEVQTQARLQLPDSPVEQILYAIVGAEPRHVNELSIESGLPIQVASGTLLALELKGLVRQTGSQHYVRA